MTTSDWVLVGSTLFLGATALLVPVVTELIKRKIFAPRLRISFELAPPYCHRTVWRSSVDPELQEPVYFFRFQVYNDGRSQARLCEAVLEDLWIYDAAGNPQKVSNFSPVNLRYDEIGTRFLNLNPKRRIYWNIGHVSSPSHQSREERGRCIDISASQADDLRFVLEQMEIFFSQPNCLVAGKYAIKVSLYSENAPHQQVYFSIAWSGKWQDSESEMFRELVVRRVNRV